MAPNNSAFRTMANSFYFTSESVFQGHPDKACDQIADAILDRYLQEDPFSKVACEVLLSSDLIILAGEVFSNASFDKKKIVEKVLEEIGYLTPLERLKKNELTYLCHLHEQSRELRRSVDEGGAGDQGLMFGFATEETPTYMPLGYTLCQKIVLHFADLRKRTPFLLSDGKTQVTIEYEEDKPKRVAAIIVSSQHSRSISEEDFSPFVEKELRALIPENLIDEKTKILINPSGSFIEGGMDADTGLTGRKIIVDTYGGYARHGGGSFSGKDPTKVDRIGAYQARHIAKNLVAKKMAKKVEVQLSYSIGIKEPISLYINAFNTSPFSQNELCSYVFRHFPLSPKEIISSLDLRRPIFQKTAFGGHFGREESTFTWERLLPP